MNKILLFLSVPAIIVMSVISFPDGAISALLVLLVSLPAIFVIKKYAPDNTFLINIFLVALYLRLAFGFIIFIFDLESLFGPDAESYHRVGENLMHSWMGQPGLTESLDRRLLRGGSSGWGMYYLVGIIYLIFGASKLVAQSFCGTVGALCAPLVYYCAQNIYGNIRVSKVAAVLVAFFPSFIIWSGQLLKDGLLIFLLLVIMIMVLELQKKFSYFAVATIILSLFGIISLRFYLFFMVAASVAAGLVIGEHTTVKSIVRNTAVLIILGLGLTYLGALRIASTDFDKYADLERIQFSRRALAITADSGFGEELDVSTPAGAVAALPLGLAYLYLAPFPWEVEGRNQAMVLPENLLWWTLLPLMVAGIIFTVRKRLRKIIPILSFTILLSLSYAIFQGNVGMVYRQRTQIQIFMFIFVGVGLVMILERRENSRMIEKAKILGVDKLLERNRIAAQLEAKN